MPVTVETLGQRVLQRLGLSLVAGTSRPTDAGTTTKASMASQALRRLGVTVLEPNERAGLTGTRTLTEMGASVLRHLGVMAVPFEQAGPQSAPVSRAEVASRALRMVGVNPAFPGFATATVDAAMLATRTLRRLGVIASDESPSPNDQDVALTTIVDVHERLTAGGIATWAVDATPRYMAQHYEMLAANLLAPSFGKVSEFSNYAAIMQEARAVALTGGRGQALAEAKVTEVHSSLARRGLADWTSDVVPAAFAADVEVIVAAYLAPIYNADMKLDAGAAEERIRLAQMLGERGSIEAYNAVRSVHDTLVNAGVADWPVDTTPYSVAGDVIAAAAAQLGPMLGKAEAPDLYSAALQRIRVNVQGRKAQAQAEAEVASAHSALVAQGLATWQIDQTPAAYGDAIASIAVAKLAPVYGGTRDPAAMDAAMKSARMMILNGPIGLAIATQKVRDVHANLSGRRRTRWLLMDIPPGIEEPYVMMASVLMAPVALQTPNPNDWVAGERMIIQQNVLPTTGDTIQVEYF